MLFFSYPRSVEKLFDRLDRWVLLLSAVFNGGVNDHFQCLRFDQGMDIFKFFNGDCRGFDQPIEPPGIKVGNFHIGKPGNPFFILT